MKAVNCCEFDTVLSGPTQRGFTRSRVCRYCGRKDPGFHGMPIDLAIREYWTACPERTRIEHVQQVRKRRAEQGLAQ